jgi:hypothetical protein
MLNILFYYGISYPIDDHEDILKLLPEDIINDSSIIGLRMDNKENANRISLFVKPTQIYGVMNGNNSPYLNFYPMELKKIELKYKNELSELNQLYDKLIIDFLPETFHLGWSAMLV